MKLKHIAAAGALAVLSTGALANDVTQSFGFAGGTINFGITHTDSLSFIDTLNFGPLSGSLLVNASLITIDMAPVTPNSNIDFTSVTLNGIPLTLSPTGSYEYAFTPTQLNLTAPLQMIVQGTTNATASNHSTYAGVLNVIAIPEPVSYMLMLTGLGLLGFVAHRRKQSAA